MSRITELTGARDSFELRLRRDPELLAFAKHACVVIGLANAETGHGVAVDIAEGRISLVELTEGIATMLAPASAWDACLSPHPGPSYHHFLAMRMRVEGVSISGSELEFAQHAHIARRIVELARDELGSPDKPEAEAEASTVWMDRSSIRGSYLSVEVEGAFLDLYVEEAGDVSAPPLIILHTAGADSRQAHPIMSDPHVRASYRVIAFDLPGHGRSDRMPHVFGEWSLTTQLYTEIILGVIRSMALKRPILLGASMAGLVCLAMALRAPEQLGGVIACEAAAHVPGRATSWPRDPRVNGMLFTSEWIDGLISPGAPATNREAIRWQYSQGGYGTFPGDIDFYSGGWDGRGAVAGIDTSVCPVVMLTGEYDYSCTPEMSAATAATIPGARHWVMPGLGHFPLCENPQQFAPHLVKALQIIERKEHA